MFFCNLCIVVAPEVIEMREQSRSSDIWSVGCTVIELLTCCPPYFDLPPMGAIFKIVSEKHPALPNDISQELKEFLLLCFERIPAKRPTAKDLLVHRWIMQGIQKSKRQVSCYDHLPLLVQSLRVEIIR